jgi:hypothetical protein
LLLLRDEKHPLIKKSRPPIRHHRTGGQRGLLTHQECETTKEIEITE